MDIRAEKLAKARKKLKDHQEKKTILGQKEALHESVQKIVPKETSSEQEITTNAFNDDQKSLKTEITQQSIELHNNQEIVDKHYSEVTPDVVTEMLITNKTNLELQINDLNAKLANLEHLYETEISNHNSCKSKNNALQSEINDLNTKYSMLLQENAKRDEEIKKLHATNQMLNDERNNLSEQLEFTKSMLTAKQSENAQLYEQANSYQSKLSLFQLQLQQLTSGPVDNFDNNRTTQETEGLLEKISYLEQKIAMLQHDKEHLNSHYEHYVLELNEQLKFHAQKNDDLSKNLEQLYNRENSLIEHISDMEIRLQNYNLRHESELKKNENLDLDLQNQCEALKKELDEINVKYIELQEQHAGCIYKIQELSRVKETENHSENICKHDNVDLTKLTADMASDKLAAQRATEQNEQLKSDVQRLEQVIVKMGKDKLELTEKWTHEKQLNKGLALKLAEVEESAKHIQNQLKAKDDEMIRLINEYREMEKQHDIVLKEKRELNEMQETGGENIEINGEIVAENNNGITIEHDKTQQLTTTHDKKVSLDDMVIQKEDAMMKLQQRFLHIMDEVANLSDEKHRLEHIVLQLQNETDTICEYVALYQQQRSLLKKREEERSNQLKIFQAECDKLKRHLEELHNLLLRLAADEQLAAFLKEETRHNDFARVKELLEKLQNSSLINPKFKTLDMNVFYPCSCCSGQLIDV